MVGLPDYRTLDPGRELVPPDCSLCWAFDVVAWLTYGLPDLLKRGRGTFPKVSRMFLVVLLWVFYRVSDILTINIISITIVFQFFAVWDEIEYIR